MALLNLTFLLGVLVLLYLSSFVLFAVIRILTGLSIQRIGYLSLRRIAYTPRDGLTAEICGLGFHIHRPTFAQPTWVSLVLSELVVTIDTRELQGRVQPRGKNGEICSSVPMPRTWSPRPSSRAEAEGDAWKHILKLRERVKRLHQNVRWLRMVDIVATNSTINVLGVGSVQVGSFTIAVNTGPKIVDRARYFFQKPWSSWGREHCQAEWIITLRSLLFTADGNGSLEVLDHALLNIHGSLHQSLDGLRDATVALKLGRVHIPYDDLELCAARLREHRRNPETASPASSDEADDIFMFPPPPQNTTPNNESSSSSNNDKEAAGKPPASDPKALLRSILRCIKEIQFAVSFAGLTKKMTSNKPDSNPILLSASMKEVGIDIHRLDPKSPAHLMYFISKDIAHEALAAALSISVCLDDGQGKFERLVYVPMATTTARTTLPSSTIELAQGGSLEEKDANVLFANSIVTSPSVDLKPRHLPVLISLMRHQSQPWPLKQRHEGRHGLISRLLPKANVKFSMHEPVVRIKLRPLRDMANVDDFDLIISSISYVSLDVDASHSPMLDMYYSLDGAMRLQSHRLYYQTCSGDIFNLMTTESLDLKAQLAAAPEVCVNVNGNIRYFSVSMVRQEIADGLRQIVRQLHTDVEPEKRVPPAKTAGRQNFLRSVPEWLVRCRFEASDFNVEVAGVDENVAEETRGACLHLDSFSAEYHACTLDGPQPRPARRRTHSRSVNQSDSDLAVSPTSPRFRRKTQNTSDGRLLALFARGLEAQIVEAADCLEVEPFVSVPRLDIVFSTSSDSHGPLFHIQSLVRSVMVQYSLYRHYAVGIAIMTLRNVFFMRPSGQDTAPQPREPNGYLSPYSMVTSQRLADVAGSVLSTAFPEVVTVDFKSSLVQIKAEMMHEPLMMIHIFGLETGRHRWSTPYMSSKLVRLYVDSPRMRMTWARIISVKNGRVDLRESRWKTAMGSLVEEKMIDIATENVRIAVPHEVIVHRIMDNVVNTAKAVQQLHHRFKTGSKEYISEKGPQDPKQVPKLSIRARNLLLEFEDGAFEWKLGIIYRTGRLEQLQRMTRQEAFRVKSKRVRDEASRHRNKARSRSALPRGRMDQSSSRLRSRSLDSLHRQDTPRCSGSSLIPRYDPDSGIAGIRGQAKVSEDEARTKLDLLNAQSWKRRIDSAYKAAQSRMREIRSAFWGSNQLDGDVDMTEKLLEVPRRPALMSAIISDFHLTLDKPAFAMQSLPDFMHDVGKGMPRDMQYSLLVPMHVTIGMGEVRVSLRDYPLPCLHIPGLRAGQSSRVPSVSLKANLVVAEELRSVESTRLVRVDVVRPRNSDAATSGGGRGFAIDVRRTISPVKYFSDVCMDINTALPTRITWGPCYQPAMQDMMMVVESFTKPQVDPSERVGFWDKIRLNTHSRIRVAWKGDGEMHLSLKGTRDPYQVTGNGAGFLMCWRSNVRWNINAEDDAKRFMTVDSGEYMLAIPDYNHLVRAAAWRDDGHDDGGSAKGEASGAMFKKVVMKLSGKVQWMAGLVFERAIEHGGRSFTFKPHYHVVLKNPAYATLDHDALHGFRSRHVHLSIAVRAPADGEWPSSQTTEATGSYNSVHLTPRFFTHFFQWWGLFSQPMSLPIRQGSLFPGREKNSKKFGRHLATVKHSLLLAPLFLSHIYRHRDVEDQADGSGGGSSATGLKVRLDSFMLDLHQRREEFDSLGRGRNAANRRSGIKIHAAQLDLASADVRAVSASKAAAAAAAEMTTVEAGNSSRNSRKSRDKRPDLARFTIPDNDNSWIDMDDFVELDWVLPTEAPAETMILPLAYAPRLTYVRQTDIGGTIAGDPTRTSPFGEEPTHLCMMSHDDEPKRVQWQMIQERLDQLEVQMLTHLRNAGEAELRMIQTNAEDAEIVDDFEALRKHTGVLREKKAFLESLLEQMKASSSDSSNGHGDSGSGSMPDIPSTSEFDSDFSNRFVVHNMQLKWNNVLRNIVLRYSHQNSQRRGFIYYLSRPAVKFILDMIEEQNKAKKLNRPAAAPTGPASKATGTSSPAGGSNISEAEAARNLEEHVKRMLNDGHRRVASGDGTLEDLESGISRDYSPQRGYHVRVIAPQMQLQSEKNKKHVVLVTAKGMELKVLEVMDKECISDAVSGLVQRRFLANLDSTQFFVTHQKWFSTKLVSMYAGSRYGAPHGSAWPPWVPMEVMFNFTADPFGFKRVVQKTSAMLRYDKYNNLRLKYDEEVNTDAGAGNKGHKIQPALAATATATAESRSDSLWIEFPQARALCNSSQYYALYVIVLDLLMYSEPLEKRRNERLEKIILASDFSDLSGAPQMVQRLQERIKQLEEIRDHFQLYVHRLDRRGWADRQTLERDLAACEDELFFLMKAITTSQRRGGGDDTSPLLKWSMSAREIVWHLVLDSNEPLVELQLKNVEYDRTDRADGSHTNLMRVGKVLGLNLLADATYPEMVAPYHGDEKAQASTERDMLRVYWHMLEAIAGIPVMDRFEVHLFPIKVQLEREIGKRLFDYIFPGMDSGDSDKGGDKSEKGDSTSATSRNQSPYMIKHEPVDEDSESLASLGSRLGTPLMMDGRDALAFSTRAGSLELRLQPTLTSNAPTAAERSPKKATASSGGGGEGRHGFRLFRSGGTGKLMASKKASYDSLRPGSVARSSTGLSSKDGRDGDGRKGSARFGLRGKGGPSSSSSDDKQHQHQPAPLQQRRERRGGQKLDDDLSQMMTRASSYVTYAHIHMPSVVLCLSYKGREQRNFEDVHDFVFRLPEMEWQNKTWSNLDLALALKKAVVKALIAHTGAIIGNKFSKHRPNAEQRSKLRELASSSALISSTPGLPGPGPGPGLLSSASAAASLFSQHTLYAGSANNDSDDSSSVYVDYSRSPPRATSARAGSTHSSIPAPAAASASAPWRTASRSSRAASGRSRRTGGSAAAASVPTHLTMTPQPPGSDARDEASASQQQKQQQQQQHLEQRPARGMGLLRPSSSGTGAPAHHRRPLLNVSTPDNRPSTSAGRFDAASAGDRLRTTGGVLRDKISALTHRRSTRESSGGGDGGG